MAWKTNEEAKLKQELATLDAELNGPWGAATNMRQYKKGSVRYDEAKAQFDKLKPQYDSVKKQYDAIVAKNKTEETAANSKKKVADEVKSAQDIIAQADKDIVKAVDLQDSKMYDTAQVNREQAVGILSKNNITAPTPPVVTAPTNSAFKPMVTMPDGSTTSADNKSGNFNWKQYAVDSKGVVQGPYTTPTGTTAIGQVVLVPIKSADGTTSTIQTFNDGTKAAAAYVKAYYPTGDTAQLTKDLLNAHYITPQEAASGSLVNGIMSLLGNWSSHAIQDTVVLGKKEPTLTLDKFLAERNMNTSGMGTPQRVITTRGDAKKMLDNYLVDLVGRPSTADEEKNFYSQLNSAENKAVQTTTNGTQVGSVLSDADRLMIAAQVAGKALKGTDAETLMNSKTPGQLSAEIKSLMSTASDYGVPMTAQDALGRLTQNLGQKNYLQAQQDRIKQTAIAVHPYLADHIKAGGTVKDVADVYARQHAQKLGTVIPDSTANKDVMSALARGISLDQYDRELQAKPEWRTTAEAHKVANDFANNILSSFGFGG